MSRPRIRRLAADVVNKIAAGEVVERPASVVKELMENAIDAEAGSIELALEQGGKRLIRVADDGSGIPAEDLPLAFESHATSKVSEADDLVEVATLGFRGEALASIGSVSQCRIVSRARDAGSGAEIECRGGRLSEPRSCGAPPGTIVEVRNLFFNTPARQKFMRTVPTELRHCVEAVTRLALPHVALRVEVTHAGRELLKLAPANSFRDRIGSVLGEEAAGALLPVHSESSALSVSGYVSPPGAGGSSATQYVFLNGRYIRDRAIHRAVAEAYRSRLMKGRYPTVILNLQMDPNRVDVNVHPTKVEVRFRDSGAVFAQVLTAIEKVLSGAGPSRPQHETGPGQQRREQVRTALSDFFRGRPSQEPAPPGRQRPIGAPSRPAAPPRPASPDETETGRAPAPPPPEAARPPVAEPTEEPPQPAPEPSVPTAPRDRGVFQLHNSYLVEETDDGFLLIDQHALHERILYEELRRRLTDAAVPRQRLLVPELIDLKPQDFLHVTEVADTLRRLGVEVEPFGERTIAVQAVPHMARGMNPRELITELIEEGLAGPDRPTDHQDRIMQMIACKAAVKAGDRLRPAQIAALLDQRDRLGPEPTCPHGRPTTIRFTGHDLEKLFRRK